jgi:hypothetical protein
MLTYEQALRAQLQLEETGTPKFMPGDTVWAMIDGPAWTQVQVAKIINNECYYLLAGSNTWYSQGIIFGKSAELIDYLKSVTNEP